MPRRPRRIYQGAWLRVRQAILARDDYACQLRGPNCTHVATEVDHIVPVTMGGDWYDEANLRAACLACNRGRVGSMRGQMWRMGRTQITVVVGPTAADASAYIRGHADPADLVVDMHALRQATGSESEAWQSFDSLVSRLRRGAVTTRRAWIAATAGDQWAGLPHHDIVRLAGPPAARDDRSLAPPPKPAGHGANPSRAW